MKTIGVFFGSRSTEHDISIFTAQLIIHTLKKLGYNVVPIYINQNGKWLISDKLGILKNFTDPKHNIKKKDNFGKYYLDIGNISKGMVFKKRGLAGKKITIDMAFPAFHGPYGEDGTIQGLFEMFSIPYVGCDVASSAIAMDKTLTKQICKANSLPTTKDIQFSKYDWQGNNQEILKRVEEKLKYPLFIKPVHLGSSIGISKVSTRNNLKEKIEVALFYDNKILVEEMVPNVMDITCAILGNENLRASLIQESTFKAAFFDFEEKYSTDGESQSGNNIKGLIIPARIEKDLTEDIIDSAKKAYKAVGCQGMARVDLLLNKTTKEYYINEINPMPGTLYSHLWKKSGLKLEELIKRLLLLARERYDKKQELTYNFESKVLDNVNSIKLSKKIQPRRQNNAH